MPLVKLWWSSDDRGEMVAFDLPGGVGFCNAVRRTLTSDVATWAPYELTIRTNTSCQTDEYLAHRIGLIPFRRVPGNTTTEMVLKKKGSTVLAQDIVGPGFEAVHPHIEVMLLREDQELDLSVHFDRQSASKHARYSPCAAVGMKALEDGKHRISFELLDDKADPKQVVLEALSAMEDRADRALGMLAHQPAKPPKSMC